MRRQHEMRGRYAMQRRRPASRAVSLALVLCVLFVGKTACRRSNVVPDERAALLSGGEVSLLLGRIVPEPRRYLSPTGRVDIRFYADPDLVNVSRVKAYTLWTRRSGTGGSWSKVAATLEGARALSFEAADGVHELHGSVVYQDGAEYLVPAPQDQPLVYVYVDRTAPALSWTRPETDSLVTPGTSLELRWNADEVQFGSRQMILDWSPDDGTTWRPIAEVAAKPGIGNYRWEPSDEVSKNILLRVRAWDSAGHYAASTVPLQYSSQPLPRPSAEEATIIASDGLVSDGLVDADQESFGPAEPNRADRGAASGQAGEGDGKAGEAAVGSRHGSGRPVMSGPVRFERLARSCARSGSNLSIAWTVDGKLDPVAAVTLEYTPAGQQHWRFGGEAPLGAGVLSWRVPTGVTAELELRLLVVDAGNSFTVTNPEPIRIDDEPPTACLENVPAAVGAEAELAVSVSDVGCGSVADIDVYLRGAGEQFWNQLPAARVKYAAETLTLSLAALDEGPYEVFLAAADDLGNRGLAPAPEAVAAARFVLDRTPPYLTAKHTRVAWVGGFEGEATIHFQPTDCVAPLVIEGRSAAGNWHELRRLSSLNIPQKTVRFPISPMVEEYEVRISVRDAVGNSGQAVLEPRAVEKAIRLGAVTGGSAAGTEAHLLAGSREKISWTLHPVAKTFADELLVRLDDQIVDDVGNGGKWQAVGERLPADGPFYWDLPQAGSRGSAAVHHLRVQLYRGDDLLAEDTTGPFRVVPLTLKRGLAVDVSEPSMKVLAEAGVALAAYRRATAPTATAVLSSSSDEEITRLATAVQKNYEKAIALDGKNYHATFGLAQFLEGFQPEKNEDDVIRWLEATVAIHPNHAEALNDLGAAFIGKEDYAQAETYLKRSLLVRESSRAHYNMGLVLLSQHKTVESRQHLERVLALGQKDVIVVGDVQRYVIYSYIIGGEIDAARRRYAEAKPDIPEALRADIEGHLAKSDDDE